MRKYITTCVGVLFLTLLSRAVDADAPSSQPVVKISFLESNAKDSFPSTLLHLNGFPKNEEISLTIQRPLLKREYQIEKFRISEQSTILRQGNPERDALRISSQGFLPGERVTAIFQTIAGDTLTTASFIPHPIHDETADHHLVVSAELTIVTPANYELRIQGLQEGEVFVLRSQSGDEIIRQAIPYESKNVIALMPAVLGKYGGTALVSITANNKTVALRLPWGSDLLSYAKPKVG